MRDQEEPIAAAARGLFETTSLGAPENAVGFLLWRVFHRYQREVDRALAAENLTHLQFTALILVAWLGRSGDPVIQSDVSRAGDIHPMQVSQMLAILESKGMVARSRSASDVRAKIVEVTDAGLESLRRSLPSVIDVQQRLFGEPGSVGGSLHASLLRIADERVSQG